MSQLPEKMKLQDFYSWLEEEEKLGGSAKDMVDKVLSSTDDDICNKIRQIVDDFSLKVVLLLLLSCCLVVSLFVPRTKPFLLLMLLYFDLFSLFLPLS